MTHQKRPAPASFPPVLTETGTQSYPHHLSHKRIPQDTPQRCISAQPTHRGHQGESVGVRPSRSAARLVDTTVGRDTRLDAGQGDCGAYEAARDDKGEAKWNWLG